MLGAGLPEPGTAAVRRSRLRVTGTVQGVGFRPFVYRHARRLGLAGFVRNDSAGVLIEVEGPGDAIAELARLLVDDAPPLARVGSVTAEARSPVGPGSAAGGFVIAPSEGAGTADAPVSVDTGTCDECLAEVDDPADRRHGYAFTNCTNCGPRYSIVVSVPYDRPATTMAGFEMCADCQREYDDPADRRFHAQPNACGVCGPRLALLGPGGEPWPGWPAGAGTSPPRSPPGAPQTPAGAPQTPAGAPDPLAAAAAALAGGAILAVKGVGGYHLAVDATSAIAVAELRRRKARDDKPFAVMVPDVATARQLADLDDAGAALLASPRRPIVLCPRRPAGATPAPAGAPTPAGGPTPAGAGPPALAPGVAPGLAELGIMLPYSPLHHLLMAALRRPMVLTSGNLSDEPIAYVDDDAVERLGALVDGILTHDRPIHIRCDDSVVRARDGTTQVLRRSRGYAPEPVLLPVAARRPLLAVGAELKSTIAVAKGATAVVSHHLGDLEHLATYRSFLQAVDHICHLSGVSPELVAHDLHPEYLSTKWAADVDLPSVAVQHHHAHVASCLVDRGRAGPVLGVAFDGLGYGPDGTLWGGELLVADLAGYRRVGHLAPVVLPGGSAAIRQPWRMATSWALASCGPGTAAEVGSRLDGRAGDLVGLIHGGSGGPTMPVTTSVGRLFDAVAALVCGRAQVSYEGQAAIELEAAAAGVDPGAVAPYPVDLRSDGTMLVLDPAPMVAAVIADMEGKREPALVAAAFHEGLAAAAVDAAARLAGQVNVGTVALTGGVFQNARLSALMVAGLGARGLEVLTHHHIPPNDGGISIGQAAVAAAS
ncbi:MAG: carbamoyltransferase HypF [Acidimicrobiales bacterium]